MGEPPSEKGRAADEAHLEVDPLVRSLGERFREAGHELYLVGGAVREMFMGRTSRGEFDLATDALPTETIALLRGWADSKYVQGVEYGTVGARKDGRDFEITTFREEVYPEDTRKPKVVFGDDVRTDLSRRDFTVNAMAIRLPKGEFLDPFGGVKDLQARRFDTPLDPEIAFGDDPLRMLRAARFTATLEMTPAPRVVEAITRMRSRLAIVSPERIRAELDRLLAAEKPSLGLELLVESQLAEEFLPELPALKLEQDPVHKHKDVLHHTFAVVERCDRADPTLRLAALLHDIGKPKTRRFAEGGVQFHHHEVVGARMAEERMRALRYPSHAIEDVRRLVEMHLRFHTYGMGWSDGAVRRYVKDAGPLLDQLNQLTRADCTTQNPFRARQFEALQDELEERIARLAEQENLQALRPPLDGNEVMEHLDLRPGPEIGQALEYLMEIRMERGPIDKEEAFELLEEWWQRRGRA